MHLTCHIAGHVLDSEKTIDKDATDTCHIAGHVLDSEKTIDKDATDVRNCVSNSDCFSLEMILYMYARK